MSIQKIINISKKPKLFEKSESVMWTDNYISKQLLKIHLDSNIDLASRKKENIERTVKWITNYIKKDNLKILDLGCGPGLYSEIFAERGHEVIGIDYSKNSINYARKNAKAKNLGIKYIVENYLGLELEPNSFDMVILIYTDFGVLNPSERKMLLKKIKTFLKVDGIFIFDVLNSKNLESKSTPKIWEISQKGFWQSKPYLVLSESFLYEESKVILYQHHVISHDESIKTYRFWTQYFSTEDLRKELREAGFRKLSFSKNVLMSSNHWDGNNVIFCKAEK